MSVIMIIVLIFLVAAAVYGVGYVFSGVHMRRLRGQWCAEQRTIHYGPVRASCCPVRQHGDTIIVSSSGVVGLVDDQLIYRGTFSRSCDISLPYDKIHWISKRPVTPPKRGAKEKTVAVQVDTMGPGGWQAYQFRLRDWMWFADALHNATNLPIRSGAPVFGPGPLTSVQATRMTQNVLGSWQTDAVGQLYLAADRLLFEWTDVIMLDRITALDLYDRYVLPEPLRALDVLTQDLLRIEYTGPHGDRQVIGFQVAHARQWGDAIAARCGIGLMVHEGRKKKKD